MRAVCVLVLPALLTVGCKRDTPPHAAPASVQEDDMALARKAAREPDPPLQPVYGWDAGKGDSLAHRFCDAVQGTPLRRTAECCNSKPGLTIPLDSCRQTLSAALASGAVTLNAADVAACGAAMERALAGCDWVGSQGGVVPAACDGIIRGTLKTGSACRSTLECVPGLFCKGAGPTDQGICQPPQPTGGVCGGAVDPLAIYTRQNRSLLMRAECEGQCEHHRCTPIPATCTTANPWQCGVDARCVDGKCVAGRVVGKGAACAGALCDRDLRCIEGTCQEPRPAGSACRTHNECAGGCLMKPGATSGMCGQFCGISGSP